MTAACAHVFRRRVYGEQRAQITEHVEWIEYAGMRGMVVLTKDEKIARRAHERAVALESNTKVFQVVARRAAFPVLCEVVVTHRHRVAQAARRRGPGFWKQYPESMVRQS